MKRHTIKLKTQMGAFSVIWSDKGISEIRLPGSAHYEAEEPVQSSELPSWLEDALAKIRQHIEGSPQNLTTIPVDLSQVPEFHRKVYLRLQRLPLGQTVSYGQLAELVGAHGAARAVGRAMSTNPIPIVIPCHRVVKSDGSLGNYSALLGQESKRRLLEMEGVSKYAQKSNT